MEPVYILTQAELDELRSTSPDQLLRDTNHTLQERVNELTKQLANGAYEHITIDTPFIVKDEKLCLREPIDFITFYNNAAQANLSDSDYFVYTHLTQLADRLNYQPQFTDLKQLKRYRVSLQKKVICKPVKRNGLIYLELKE